MFISSKNIGEEIARYSKSENITVLLDSDTNEQTKIIFDSIVSKHQNNLLENINKSDVVFDYVHGVLYSYYKTTLKKDGSYIESSN